MATLYWLGRATTTAQVATATFGVYDVATTRSITIGNVSLSAADSGGTLTTAMTALAVVLNASTHPYFSTITWTSNATQIIGTADTAGVQFVFAGSVSGGTGTLVDAFTVSTTNTGPNDWRSVDNWSTDAIPANGDTVIFKDNAVNVSWGLAQSAVALADLQIEKSYTGKIGLRRDQFATSASAETTNSSYTEYRDTYLQIATSLLSLGKNLSPGNPTGSGRIKIDLGSTACTAVIFDTASTASETGLPAVRVKANSATTDFFVRSAPGGLGVAVDLPGETTTIRKISISDVTSASRVFLGTGVTVTTWEQYGGNNILQAAATVTTVTVVGGSLLTEGTAATTTMNAKGGTITSNSTGTITTLNMDSGTVDFTQSNQARTVTTVSWTTSRGTLKADGAVLTVTTLNDPSGKYQLVAS